MLKIGMRQQAILDMMEVVAQKSRPKI